MSKIYKNWHAHNMLGHPIMHILNCIGLHALASKVHDSTLPPNEYE